MYKYIHTNIHTYIHTSNFNTYLSWSAAAVRTCSPYWQYRPMRHLVLGCCIGRNFGAMLRG